MWRLGGSIASPSAAYAAVWALVLGWIPVASQRFHAVSTPALFVYLTGAVGVALGGVAVTAIVWLLWPGYWVTEGSEGRSDPYRVQGTSAWLFLLIAGAL